MLRKVVLLTLVWALGAAAQAGEPLRLMTNPSPPYADAKLPEQGLALELVRHLFAGTGYEPQIDIENWSRAVEGAQLGVYDGLASVWYSEERDKDLLFSAPYLESELIILTRRDKRPLPSLQALSGHRLGVRTDYAYGVDFAAIPRLTLVEENHLIQNLLNLLNGSVDAVIGDRRTVNQQLREYLADRINEFQVAPVELPTVKRHVAINRSRADHEAVVDAFNKSLAKAQKDGSLEAIVKRWDERYVGIE